MKANQGGPAAQPAGEWRANWKMMIPCIAGIPLSTVHGYSLQIMVPPLEQEFGWTRAEITIGPIIMAMVALFVAPMIGSLVDRYGPRRIGLVGVGVFCLSLAALSLANSNPLSWLICWLPLSFGGLMVLPTIWTAAINSVFDKSRGLALAVALCGTGVGSAIVPKLTYELVQLYGWRGGYVGLAILTFVVIFPLVLFLFHSAADAQSGGKANDAPKPKLSGEEAMSAVKSARFLKLATASFILSIAVCVLIGNAVLILGSKGFAVGDAASIAGLVGLGAIIGRLGGGYLLDRMTANYVAAVSVLLPLITVTLLLFAPPTVLNASIAYFVLGFATGTELDAVAYLAARHFGLKSFGFLFGLMNGMMLFANGISPFMANFVYDQSKSYDIVLWVTYPMFVITSILFALLGPYLNFEDKKVEHAEQTAAAEGAATHTA